MHPDCVAGPICWWKSSRYLAKRYIGIANEALLVFIQLLVSKDILLRSENGLSLSFLKITELFECAEGNDGLVDLSLSRKNFISFRPQKCSPTLWKQSENGIVDPWACNTAITNKFPGEFQWTAIMHTHTHTHEPSVFPVLSNLVQN